MINFKKILALFTVTFISIHCNAIEVAFFDVDNNGGVYLHASKDLEKSDKILVMSDDQEKGCCLKFSGKEFSKIGNSEQVSSDDDGRSVFQYKLSSKSNIKFKIQTSAAIIGNVKLISTGKEEFKFSSSSKNYVVNTCYGTEGRNLYLKRQGKQIQHLYYYFNYAIETNCKQG